MDLFGDSTSTGPDPRLRQAYGELTNILFGGDLLVGQAWSTFVYGSLKADNQAAQPSDSFNETQYASANLIWMPIERWLLGVEGLWGKREDKDGADGTDFRTQFTSRFTC